MLAKNSSMLLWAEGKENCLYSLSSKENTEILQEISIKFQGVDECLYW
jgi:hypothetical protein